MRDLAQSHSIADAYTMETLEAYSRDSVLAQFPIPRMSIREAQLTLRFAVDSVTDPPVEPDPAEFRELWLKTLRNRVVPTALAEVGRVDNKRVVAAFDKRLGAAAVDAAIDPDVLLTEGREEELVRTTLKFLGQQVESFPASTRKSVDNTDLSGAFERVVRDEMAELQRAARQLEKARVAAQSDVAVLVTAEALTAVPQSQISEITLTVTMDDVQFGTADEQTGNRG